MASTLPHDLLTAREVAEVMRVSTMTVYRLIKAGELPALRVGKHLRIRQRDLIAYLDARVIGVDVATDREPTPGDGATDLPVTGVGRGPWPAA